MASTTPPTSPIQITFLTAGSVRIRPSMRSQPATSFALTRRLRSLCDRRWTDPMPVGVFLLQHATEGTYLFDTGQSPCCNDRGYFPRAALFNSLLSEFTIERGEGIVSQLARRGIRATDLTGVILSHLHNDHAGGLEDLVAEAPDLRVYISREHWDAFGKRPLFASFEGATPNHWPEPFTPTIVDFADAPLGPWKQSFTLTSDGSLVLVDTSGHVPGHMALVVRSYSEEDKKPVTYFLPGDATYGIDVLDREEPDGINDDPMRALQTLRRIKEFARQGEVVVLPSHDRDAPRLLAERVVYRPDAAKAAGDGKSSTAG
ncbi:beta-lactamase-like protein [Aspergillus carlsbadensis]|nr:beta-lactamase-like protein [Aspergillus carlsbadensis]